MRLQGKEVSPRGIICLWGRSVVRAKEGILAEVSPVLSKSVLRGTETALQATLVNKVVIIVQIYPQEVTKVVITL